MLANLHKTLLIAELTANPLSKDGACSLFSRLAKSWCSLVAIHDTRAKKWAFYER